MRSPSRPLAAPVVLQFKQATRAARKLADGADPGGFMFRQLEEINARPEVFEIYTAEALWADDHRAEQMLAFHLDETVDVSSRNIEFIDRSSAWITDTFRLGPGKRVCDFGCGPGLYASRLAKSGAQVTGLDFSRNSIRYAREEAERAGQKIDYVHGNYLAFDPTQRYDLIVMIMCDFCALSPVQRQQLLTIFQNCLADDGALLLDVYSMAAYSERAETSFYERNQLNGFWCEEDYYCFVNTFKYDRDAVVLDKYSIFPKSGAPQAVYNWLQYFSPESLTTELSGAGFATKQIYGDVSGRPFTEQNTEFAIVATKAT